MKYYNIFPRFIKEFKTCLEQSEFEFPKWIFTLLILFCASITNGQDFCGTTAGPNYIGVLPQAAVTGTGPYNLKVYMHIIQRSNGSGGISLSQLDESKTILDNAFAPHQIFFNYNCEVIYLKDDRIFDSGSEDLCGLRSNYSHSDGIDVYIGGDNAAFGGRAEGIVSYGFVVSGTRDGKVYSRSLVIAHEMGHCLGLWHTHHGTNQNGENGTDCFGNPSSDPNACPECVDQSNNTGTLCGDYIQETPADFNIGRRVNSSCQFLGNDIDNCTSLAFSPSTINIMSYTTAGCMISFVNEQGARMRTIIDLDQGLKDRLASTPSNSVTHIYSYTPITSNQIMQGDIIIHTGAELDILDCTIQMPWHSKIIVERGAELLVSNSIITRACGAPDWQGIYVYGNANIPQPDPSDFPTTNQSGIVLIVNGSTVEWARTAISTSKPGGYFGDYFGGLVYASNSTFQNNHRVAEFMKYGSFNKSAFQYCILDGMLRYNAVGVTIWDTEGIAFNFNHIQNMPNAGILIIDGGAFVQEKNYFTNCGDGIYAGSTYFGTGNIEVTGNGTDMNEFDNNKYHIRAMNTGPYTVFDVVNNKFYFAQKSGIEFVGPTWFYINLNTFGRKTTTSLLLAQGIYVSDCGSQMTFPFNSIARNIINTSNIGIQATSENRELQFRCNTFNCRYDFYNKGGSAPGAIAIQQGFSQYPAHNCFTSPKKLYDILSRTNVLNFKYFTFNASCKLPTSVGNYNNILVTETPFCTARPNNFGPISIGELFSLKDKIASLGTPVTQEDKDSLISLKQAKDFIRNGLIKQVITSGEMSKLDSIVMGEDTTVANLIYFSAYLKNNLFSNALYYLSLLPNTNEFSEFKQIQSINISRMQNEATYNLTSSDSTFLSSVAYSISPNRGFARVILKYLKNIDIYEPESTEPDTTEYQPIILNTNIKIINQSVITPNPTSDFININLDFNDSYFDFEICNLEGYKLMNGRVDHSNNSINLQNLFNGVYIIKLKNKKKDLNYISKIFLAR